MMPLSLFDISFLLLLANVDIHRCAGEVPTFADLVLKETLIGLLYILRQVGEEYKRGYACARQLHAILDLDVLTLV